MNVSAIIPVTPLRRLGVASLLAAAIGLPGALPAAAGIPSGTYTELETSVPLSGLAGTWRFELFASDGGPGAGTVNLGHRKRNASGSAWASERWMAVDEPLTCGPKLAACTLDSGDDLGSFGAVKLTFAAKKPLKTSAVRCPGSDVAYGTRRTRTGVLTGTVALRTKSDLVGTIRNGRGPVRTTTRIPATVTRTTFDPTVSCPPPTSACAPWAVLRMDEYLVGANRELPTGPGRISFGRRLTTGEPGVIRSQSIDAAGPGADLLTLETKQTLAGATLGLARAKPFLSGSVAYAASSGLLDATLGSCAIKRTTGTLTYGIVVRMPGRSPATLSGSDQGVLDRVIPS